MEEGREFVDGPDGARLSLRGAAALGGERGAVLFVHGATFPSALSIAFRFDGRSWRDALCAAGLHVWALDLQGFGDSDRYPAMADAAAAHSALGRVAEASRQVEAALQRLRARHRVSVSLLAHSWGTMVAGDVAGRCPDLVDRLVLFAPIARRSGATATALPAWRLVTLDEQWARFNADTPEGAPPALLERHFARWGEAYLDSDPGSRARTPPAVKVPNGPAQEIAEAWAGRLAYDPSRIHAPVTILRGEWDSLSTGADAASLLAACTSAAERHDHPLGPGGHLLHLEEHREALHRASIEALCAR